MSFLGDLLKFEGFNAKRMLGKVKENPEQLLLGAADPFGAKLWSGITGKDYSPIVNEWGGATPDSYRAAEAAGINTGPGRTGHNIAQMIAASYAGGYGADKLGALGGAGGATGGGGGANAAQEAFRASELAGGYGAAGSGGGAAVPSGVNLVNAGGVMSTGSGGGLLSGMSGGDASNYLRQVGDAAGTARQMGLLGGGAQQQAPAVSLQSRGDPIGDMINSQAQLEAIRRQRRGLLAGGQ